MKRMLKKLKKETGQGLVEFALILPIFLLLVLGMMEYGWLLNAQITANSAAKEFARAAVVADSREIPVRVETAKTNLGLTDVTYVITNPTATSGQQVTITVTRKVTPLVGFFFKEDQNITSKATMRVE